MTAQSIGRSLREASPVPLNVELRLSLLASNQADHEGRLVALEQFAREGEMSHVTPPVPEAPSSPAAQVVRIEHQPRFTMADKVMAAVVVMGAAANVAAMVEMVRIFHRLGLTP